MNERADAAKRNRSNAMITLGVILFVLALALYPYGATIDDGTREQVIWIGAICAAGIGLVVAGLVTRRP